MIPAPLLHAISQPGGGRVVLVIGAGTSVEHPTCLPAARRCAEEAHRRLIADGVLENGDCTNPADLSELAEVVFTKTGRQKELVERLPQQEFRMARPNIGSLLAAALLLEGAVSSVLSLNFDLSLQKALGDLGATRVEIIRGPEDQSRIGMLNLIYLHRSVEDDPEKWVLRSSDLETSWYGKWQEMMAQRVVSAAVTVFAGLGSPASVLTETAEKVRIASEGNAAVMQVDPTPYGQSEFAQALQVPKERYIQLGWCDFMLALSERVLVGHLQEICHACNSVAAREGWEDAAPADLMDRLKDLGLIEVGRLRANWLLLTSSYVSHDAKTVELMADLLLAVGLIEARTGYEAIFESEGIVDFVSAEQIEASIVLCSGRGSLRWSSLEATLSERGSRRSVAAHRPKFAVVGGCQGSPSPSVSPKNVAGELPGDDDILAREPDLRLVAVDDLRQNPALIDELVA